MVPSLSIQPLPMDGPRLFSAPKELLIDLTVVIPVHNEEENAVPLYTEVKAVLDTTDLDWECIIVDDGSTDRTIENLLEAFPGDPRLCVVGLRRNFGQTAGLAAGFDRARGQYIATMDGDLQNDPADIPKMLEALNEGRGYDVVSGWRKSRQDKFFSRRMPSMIANKLISRLTWTPIHDFGCAMKVYRREALQDVQLYGEMHRFLPALCVWKGARITERVVNHRARVAGTSKYGLIRTGKVILDLMTVKFLNDYLAKPLYLFGKLSFVSIFIAFLSIGVAISQKYALFGLSEVRLNNNVLVTFSGMMVLLAAQMLVFGIISELLVRIYHEAQGKRPFGVREVIWTKDIDAKDHESGA
jgi:glycosyltransferase involved in cell wall biosynthesis